MSHTGNKRNAEGVEASGVICDGKVPIKLRHLLLYTTHSAALCVSECCSAAQCGGECLVRFK